ncbi:MAG: hemerythrin family protein [Candidatus Accumulibacter phosphatis]|jgi:hemerythrin|nr:MULTISPECIES: hemerythrin family protein [Candidatus Accumulibacter]MBL8406771.1 hemerythrin family protein [Accumulibacter sp.]NMQ04485.1 bacteriohemerythrin [Candidatus Accumulibacter contiguus]HRF11881.1 hemerythrin family protein [Candidatus Accumulibacter phosphatis]
MTFLMWPPALEIGHEQIDREHRELVALLNRAHAASVAGDQAEALDVLVALERYTEIHFAHEEALMDEIAYEFTAIHRSEHRQLFFDVKNMIDDSSFGTIDVAAVSQFMQRWLLRHIAGPDLHLGEALARARPVNLLPANSLGVSH